MSVLENLRTREYRVRQLNNPRFVQALFGDVRWAWIWLALRLYLGWHWLQPGWEKLHSPVWTGSQAGVAITGFVNNALTKTGGPHPDVQAWYAAFLQHAVLANPVLWSHLISWGEFLVGVGLIVGALTGLAALFGALLNLNYLLAGAVSLNPVMLISAILLLAAWRTAGWWGLDRWILSILGQQWRREEKQAEAQERSGTCETRPKVTPT